MCYNERRISDIHNNSNSNRSDSSKSRIMVGVLLIVDIERKSLSISC